MKFGLTLWRWHRAIIVDAQKKLGRKLESYLGSEKQQK
jgi:hypothetical protein